MPATTAVLTIRLLIISVPIRASSQAVWNPSSVHAWGMPVGLRTSSGPDLNAVNTRINSG